MPEQSLVRETAPDELEDILALYARAFPDEDLRPIVEALLTGDDTVLSLAALEDAQLAGHVLFTIFDTHSRNDQTLEALLAPLCVAPQSQGQGIGTRLVRDGFDQLSQRGIARVFVLGDPAYYGRFGFASEREVLPPYELPDEWAGAWQSFALSSGEQLPRGRIKLPDVWMNPALWLP